MRYAVAFTVVALLLRPATALEPPDSVTHARIELRPGTTPAAAMDDATRARYSGWIGWSVASIPGARNTCCFSGNFKRTGCSLSDRVMSWGSTNDGKNDPGAGTLLVLVETRNGAAMGLRIASPDCPIEGADRPLQWLGPVEGGASLAALSRLLETKDNDVAESALTAIAYHQDTKADALIEKRALDKSLSTEARRQAAFWAGNARGEAGYRLLDRVLASETNKDLRENAVFALSQSSVAGAPDRIKRVAVEDRDRDLRAHALFCLTQTKSEGTGAWILSRLDAERDDHVREQAVFALSQLEDGTDWLLRVLRSKRDPETTRRAFFWLGQSNDPRALEELEKVLTK